MNGELHSTSTSTSYTLPSHLITKAQGFVNEDIAACLITPDIFAKRFKGQTSSNLSQMKNSKIFLILAQNINCGYTFEPPHVPTIFVI